jgi:hypothetical protein
MAEPIGAARPSSAAANTRQSTPQKRCGGGVGAGICAPSSATPPTRSAHSYKPMDPKIAQQRAERLIADAIRKNSHDRLILFSEINQIFQQERWAVRHAMRADPYFEKIVDGAARALIDACLEGTKDGDKVMTYFHQRAMDSHPELAAAYVTSAVRIFEKKGVVFSPPDRQLRALASHIGKSDRREDQRVKEAIRATDRLGQMVAKPNT